MLFGSGILSAYRVTLKPNLAASKAENSPTIPEPKMAILSFEFCAPSWRTKPTAYFEVAGASDMPAPPCP